LIEKYDTSRSFTVLIQLPEERLDELFTDDGIAGINSLKAVVTKDVLPVLRKKQIMEENLNSERSAAIAQIGNTIKNEVQLIIADDLMKKVLVPNSRIDKRQPRMKRTPSSMPQSRTILLSSTRMKGL
jgi:hypothetical protein